MRTICMKYELCAARAKASQFLQTGTSHTYHICLLIEDIIKETFQRHPLYRQPHILCVTIIVSVTHIPWQAKVRNPHSKLEINPEEVEMLFSYTFNYKTGTWPIKWCLQYRTMYSCYLAEKVMGSKQTEIIKISPRLWKKLKGRATGSRVYNLSQGLPF